MEGGRRRKGKEREEEGKGGRKEEDGWRIEDEVGREKESLEWLLVEQVKKGILNKQHSVYRKRTVRTKKTSHFLPVARLTVLGKHKLNDY